MSKVKTPEEIVNDIREACATLGWYIGMNESREGISGLVIGQQEYVEEILEQIADADEYSIYDSGDIVVGLQ